MNPDTYTGNGTGIQNPALGKGLNALLGNNDGGVSFFNSLLPKMIGLILTVGVVIFFFMLLIGAIQWISSGGDKQGLESAKGKLTSAFIGIILLFSTFAIMKLIEVFFGINILTIDIGPLVIQ